MQLRDNLFFQITNVANQFNAVFTNRLTSAKVGITAEQFSVLMTLSRHGGLNQVQLSNRLQRDKATITRALTRLKKRGLIKQIADPLDGRAYSVLLTYSGKVTLEKALREANDLYKELLEGVNDARVSNAFITLEVINQHLQEIGSK